VLSKGHVFAILGISLTGLLILSLQFESAYGLERTSYERELQINQNLTLSFDAPQSAKQFISITGDSFLVELQTPRGGLQINDEQFKKELTIEWVHLLDGKSSLSITNTGNTLVRISGTLEKSDVSILVDEPAGMGFYENKLYDFSIKIPENWESIENLETVDYQAVQVAFIPINYPVDAEYIPNIMISFENVGVFEDPFISNEVILELFAEQLRLSNPSARIINADIEKTSWGWIITQDVGYTEYFDIDYLIQIHTEQTVIQFTDGEAYTIAYSSSEDYYNEFYPTFEQTLETLEIQGIKIFSKSSNSANGGGCLIATATFGSELAPQVQQLRELRDNHLLKTESGSSFMVGFNELYYSFSPVIADLERQSPIFKEAVKLIITPLITSLSLLNYVDMDSEAEVLGYGISLILFNIGMYFVVPALVINKLRRLV